MKLYLVRHGQAVKGEPDDLRPLDDEGKAEVRRMAVFLKKAGVKINRIMHSGKARAEQTAEILKDGLGVTGDLVIKDYIAPEDSTERILEDIGNFEGNLMIVGHMPFLGSLVSSLVLGREHIPLVKFKTGAVVMLKNDAGQGWQITGFVPPDLV